MPKPTARWICAGIASSEELGPQWAGMAERTGLSDGLGVSVLADGAKWIWKQVAAHLPRSECVVDVFHVSEHLHGCGRSLYGDQTEEARQWAVDRLQTLLASGPIALLREQMQPDDMVLIKGSRAAGLELLVTALSLQAVRK